MKTLAFLIALVVTSASDLRAGDVTQVPEYDNFIVIPLRFHVLTSNTLDLANSKLTDAEVARAVLQINQIWHKAGIHFGLESIVREPAVQVDRFRTVIELDGGNLTNVGALGYLLPPSSRSFDGLHVYAIGESSLNSAYLPGGDATIVNENPKLRQVEGGTDHGLARVAARGLGAALWLGPRQDDFGLMSSATNGIRLGEDEVERARKVARTIPGAFEVASAVREAEAATERLDIPRSLQLWTWLSEIPGPGATLARKRIAALPSGKP